MRTLVKSVAAFGLILAGTTVAFSSFRSTAAYAVADSQQSVPLHSVAAGPQHSYADIVDKAAPAVVTIHHVVDGADQISVELTDRRTFEAKLIGADAPSDLALLKIEASNLPLLSLGDSIKVRVGDVCLAGGNPLGIGETVTAGIISAKGRATGLSDGSFEDFLQTDAGNQPG